MVLDENVSMDFKTMGADKKKISGLNISLKHYHNIILFSENVLGIFCFISLTKVHFVLL